MVKAAFTLDGLPGLRAAVEAMGGVLRANVIHAVAVTAANVQQHARDLAPKDRGDLAANIAVDGEGLIRRVGMRDVDLAGRGGTNRAHRNPSVYAVWYEFGFKTRNILAHPFMGPARDAEEGPHLDRLVEAVNGAMDGKAVA